MQLIKLPHFRFVQQSSYILELENIFAAKTQFIPKVCHIKHQNIYHQIYVEQLLEQKFQLLQIRFKEKIRSLQHTYLHHHHSDYHFNLLKIALQTDIKVDFK